MLSENNDTHLHTIQNTTSHTHKCTQPVIFSLSAATEPNIRKTNCCELDLQVCVNVTFECLIRPSVPEGNISSPSSTAASCSGLTVQHWLINQYSYASFNILLYIHTIEKLKEAPPPAALCIHVSPTSPT